MFFFVFPILVYWFSSIPIKECLDFFWQYGQNIKEKLDLPLQNVWFSKKVILVFLTQVLVFFQGFLPLFIAEHQFSYDDFMIAVAAIASLLGYLWSPLKRFKISHHMMVYLWGIYSYIFPILFIAYLPIIWAGAICLDSFAKSYLLFIFVMFFIIWAILPMQFIPINFAVFFAAFLSQKDRLFSYKSWTLQEYFSHR